MASLITSSGSLSHVGINGNEVLDMAAIAAHRHNGKHNTSSLPTYLLTSAEFPYRIRKGSGHVNLFQHFTPPTWNVSDKTLPQPPGLTSLTADRTQQLLDYTLSIHNLKPIYSLLDSLGLLTANVPQLYRVSGAHPLLLSLFFTGLTDFKQKPLPVLPVHSPTYTHSVHVYFVSILTLLHISLVRGNDFI